MISLDQEPVTGVSMPGVQRCNGSMRRHGFLLLLLKSTPINQPSVEDPKDLVYGDDRI